jgi:hypothetical protein
VSSSFSAVLAGNEREALLAVSDQLSAELGYRGEGETPNECSGAAGLNAISVGTLEAEDEALVAGLRRGLSQIAAALAEDRWSEGSRNPIGAALDGAEMVIRGELMMGNGSQLPALMPAFVFLVVLPVVPQDEALELSERTAKLLEGSLRSQPKRRALDRQHPSERIAWDRRKGVDG